MAEDNSDVASPFSRRPFTEKLIKKRKTNSRTGIKRFLKVKKVERHFKTDNYQRYPWMTGCKKTNRLYCWSCLL